MGNLIFRLEHRTQMYYRSTKVHAGFYRVVHEIGMMWAFMEEDNLSERSVHPCPYEVCLRVYHCEEIIHGYTQAIFNVDKDVELLAEFNPDVKADEVYAVLGDYLAAEV